MHPYGVAPAPPESGPCPQTNKQATTMSDEAMRFAIIRAAYVDALGDRDPVTVSLIDMLPIIRSVIPDVSLGEIVAASRKSKGRDHE